MVVVVVLMEVQGIHSYQNLSNYTYYQQAMPSGMGLLLGEFGEGVIGNLLSL